MNDTPCPECGCPGHNMKNLGEAAMEGFRIGITSTVDDMRMQAALNAAALSLGISKLPAKPRWQTRLWNYFFGK